MADTRDEIEAALEEARRAREEADRVRKEADRLRKEGRQEAERLREDARRARDEARRLREDARRESKEERKRGMHGPHFAGPPGRPGPRVEFRFEGEVDPDATPSEQAFSMEGVRSVTINQTAGKLTVRPCKEGETPGITSTGNKSTPEIHLQRDGDRLVIEIKLNKGWLFRRRQGATTLVRLEDREYEQVRIDNGYGETEINALSAADFRVHVGAGAIQCLLTRGSLDVDVGAGKVSVLSHSGLARCDSGTGDVLLDIAELAHGEYKVDVGLGRAEVRFPPGGEVFIRTASGIGKSRVEYPSAAEGAPTSLRLNSGIGECVVKARDATGAGAPSAVAGQPKPQRGGRAATASRRREAEEMRVLQMLEQGKITPQDAADLIAALQGSTAPQFEDDEPQVFR